MAVVAAGAGALVMALVLAGWLLVSSAPRPEVVVEAAATAPADGLVAASASPPGSVASSVPASDLLVDVEGAVVRPGLYRLPPGSRVGDAIAAAGGYGVQVDAAATSYGINLAEPLVDGAKVRVPVRGEAPAPAATSASDPGGSDLPGPTAGTPSGPIDLNRATQAELESLPGIGPVTAQEILAARSAAPFTSVEELRTRELVGPKTYEKIAPLVTVGG